MAMTCGNDELTTQRAADTFRIAPSGPRTGRRDRTRRQGPRRRAGTLAEGSGRTETPDRAERPQGHSARTEFPTLARPRGRDQRPAGTSRDEPAGVRRPGPKTGRQSPAWRLL